MQNKSRLSLPSVFLLVFIVLANVVYGVYAGLSMRPSPAFQLLYGIGLVWVLGWWLIDDNKKYGLTWVSSLEITLYAFSWIVIPFYLFTTRGLKAFLIILSFIGVYWGTYFLGVILGVTVNVFSIH